jgi:hypothetical protein
MAGLFRADRLEDLRLYFGVLFQTDMSSLVYDRVIDILDNDYEVTLADFADAVASTNPPRALLGRFHLLSRLASQISDHTLKPISAGRAFEMFYDLDESPRVRPDDSTLGRALSTLLTREPADLEASIHDNCAMVRTAVRLNPICTAGQWDRLEGDASEAVLTASARKTGHIDRHQHEAWLDAMDLAVSGTECGCQPAPQEFNYFCEQLGVFRPEYAPFGKDFKAIGRWAWSTQAKTERVRERKVFDAVNDVDVPDEYTISFGQVGDELISLRLRFCAGPIAGLIEVSDSARPDEQMEDRLERRARQPLLTLPDEMLERWREAADVLQSVWEHIPRSEMNPTLGPRPREVRWVYRSVGTGPNPEEDSKHFIELKRAENDFQLIYPLTVHDAHAFLTNWLDENHP